MVRQRLGVALLLLAGCSSPEPARPEAPAQPPAAEGELSLPEAAPGLYRLIVPGEVEIWQSEDSRQVRFDRKRRLLTRSDQPEAPVKAKRKWREWEPLMLCLGRPLADPPAEDEGAYRKLAWDERPRWVLQYSGMNRCSATGVIILEADGPGVDVSGLVIDGLPWPRGGLERARELGMGYVQSQAVEWWLSGSDPEREVLLRTLRDDPDPGSADALYRILEVAGPAERPLVESAIEFRPRQGPVTPTGEAPKGGRPQ